MKTVSLSLRDKQTPGFFWEALFFKMGSAGSCPNSLSLQSPPASQYSLPDLLPGWSSPWEGQLRCPCMSQGDRCTVNSSLGHSVPLSLHLSQHKLLGPINLNTHLWGWLYPHCPCLLIFIRQTSGQGIFKPTSSTAWVWLSGLDEKEVCSYLKTPLFRRKWFYSLKPDHFPSLSDIEKTSEPKFLCASNFSTLAAGFPEFLVLKNLFLSPPEITLRHSYTYLSSNSKNQGMSGAGAMAGS